MNDRTLRFGDYQRLLTAGRNEVSFNTFTPELERDPGGELIACPPQRVKLNTVEALRVLQPYVTVRFMEQVRAVVPLALYLALLQILFLQHMAEDSWIVTGGASALDAPFSSRRN